MLLDRSTISIAQRSTLIGRSMVNHIEWEECLFVQMCECFRLYCVFRIVSYRELLLLFITFVDMDLSGFRRDAVEYFEFFGVRLHIIYSPQIDRLHRGHSYGDLVLTAECWHIQRTKRSKTAIRMVTRWFAPFRQNNNTTQVRLAFVGNWIISILWSTIVYIENGSVWSAGSFCEFDEERCRYERNVRCESHFRRRQSEVNILIFQFVRCVP